MEYIYSVEEATQYLYDRLAEATGWKFLKSQRCLKKTVKELVFEINFFLIKVEYISPKCGDKCRFSARKQKLRKTARRQYCRVNAI